MRATRWGLLAIVALLAVNAAVLVLVHEGRTIPGGAHDMAAMGSVVGTPSRYTGPQGRVGQFVVECAYSHSSRDDPIVLHGQPGLSHLHDFFGATATDASSRAADLVDGDTTCDKRGDTAAYWQPALYDHGRPVEPVSLDAYYRAAPGVDPASVQAFPFGLELMAGDPAATAPTGTEAAGWVCGSSTQLHADAPDCPASAPLHLLLTFPDCWDGKHLRSADHRSHAAYSTGGSCPDSHPVRVPQLTVSVDYRVYGTGHDLTLASGGTYSAHGDFLNAWHADALEREVDNCIRRGAVCDLASNRAEEPLFKHR
jgi:hypothetical protein